MRRSTFQCDQGNPLAVMAGSALGLDLSARQVLRYNHRGIVKPRNGHSVASCETGHAAIRRRPVQDFPYSSGRAVRASCPRSTTASQAREPDSPPGFRAKPPFNPLRRPVAICNVIGSTLTTPSLETSLLGASAPSRASRRLPPSVPYRRDPIYAAN
jgi:hypothetical protein